MILLALYRLTSMNTKIYEKHGALCVEMESFALFANAPATGKMLHVFYFNISDSPVTHEQQVQKNVKMHLRK